MNLLGRYRRLTFWNKVAFWGSVASLVSIPFAIFYPLLLSSLQPVKKHQPPPEGLLRFRYLRFSGDCLAVDLTRGSGIFKEQFAKAYILHNPVFDAIQNITERYLARPDEACADDEPAPSRSLVSIIPAYGYAHLLDLLSSSSAYQLVDYEFSDRSDDFRYRSVVAGFPDRAEADRLMSRQENEKECNRPHEKYDINCFVKSADSLSYRLQQSNPAERGIWILYSELRNSDICGEETKNRRYQGLYYARALTPAHEAYGTFILSRYIEFILLDVENISSGNLNIDQLSALSQTPSAAHAFDIRHAREQELFALRGKPFARKLPFGSLLPGEHLLVPLELGLGPQAGAQELSVDIPSMQSTQNAMLERITGDVSVMFVWPYFIPDLVETHPWQHDPKVTKENIPGARVHTKAGWRPLEIVVEKFHAADLKLRKARIGQVIAPRLFFGPTERVPAITVKLAQDGAEGLVIPVRKARWQDNVSTIKYAIGSCPFVYTRAKADPEWHFDTKLFPANSSAEKNGLSIVALTHFDGSLLLREEEDERAFIDMLRVMMVTAEGTVVLEPENDLLKRADGQGITLERGQSVLVSFDMPHLSGVKEVLLQAGGFFERHH